jgi:hypothetical protein
MTGIRRAARLSVFGLILLFPCIPAHPATLFLAVSESVDFLPGPLPPPATEGIFDALFEAGHIVFNTRDGSEIPPKTELVAIAVAGGAGFILEVRVEYTRTPRSEGVDTVDAVARYSLLAASSGNLLASGVVKDSNRGREKEIDLAALGFRLGGKVVERASGGMELSALASEKKS